MGILRADRITGLGGANAIKGSTKLSSNRLLEVHGAESNEDFRLSNGSFTIEFWAYVSDTSNSTFVALFENNPARRSYQFEVRSNQALRFEWWTDGSSGSNLTSSTGSFIRERWHHFAVVRNGTALNIYVDGTSVANTTTSDTFYENTIEPLTIGGIFQSGALTQDINGFISNLRIIKGEAIYTANFTPPTSELTVTSNTVALACQSSGNIFQEATGKTVVARTTSANDAPPEASHFTPNSPVGFSTTTDVGSQYGSTFDGFGNFATSTYMVPPGGNTRERNRGRGIIAGGCTPLTSSIDPFNIQSQGNSVKFGNLQSGSIFGNQMCSSSIRGISGGGAQPTIRNFLDFITIANESDSTDFGDLTSSRRDIGALSNQTRGMWTGGNPGSSPNTTDTIDFVTIATAGNASDFGNLTASMKEVQSSSSPTRGIIGGGNTVPATINTIQFITIASTGNASDFGDLTRTASSLGAVSSSTRGVFANGGSNTIDFVTIASTGNAADFGDSTVLRAQCTATMSNSIRGVFAGGYQPSPNSTDTNTVDYITISTRANAQDFGDISRGNNDSNRESGGCSDSHGGLS